MANINTITDIICNLHNKDYSLNDAATDLGELISELKQIEGLYGLNTQKSSELRLLISLQEKLALIKTKGSGVSFELPEGLTLKALKD